MITIILLQLFLGHAPEDNVSIAIGQAWVESRYDPTAVSRVRGALFCGIWQVQVSTEEECVAMQDTLTAWKKRREEMQAWLRFCRGNITCALNGYGCGVRGAREGRCNRYAERVLWRARDLHRRPDS